MLQIDFGLLLEELGREMQRASVAARTIVDLAGLRLREVDQLCTDFTPSEGCTTSTTGPEVTIETGTS